MGVFVFVLVAGKAIRDGMELIAIGKANFVTLSKVFILLVLYVINYALPLGLLTAILLVLGRLSAQREITALKASGVSLYNISFPIFLIAIIGTLFSLLFNSFIAPKSKAAYFEILAHSLKENPLEYLQANSFINYFPGYVLYIGQKDYSELKDIWIWELDDASRVVGLIKARKGFFDYDSEKSEISLSLTDGVGEKRTGSDPEKFTENSIPLLTFDKLTLNLSIENLFNYNPSKKQINTLTVTELIQLRKTIPGNTEQNKIRRNELNVQIQKKLAMAFSVLAMVLIAVPLGIKASRKETHANLAIALILAVTYYALVIMITWLDEFPRLRPDLLIWLPNIIFIILGFFLLRRANRN